MFNEYVEQSVAVILENQQPSGAYPASPYFAPYAYTWFRDGSFTADAMSRVGEIESAEKFFAWGAKIIIDRQELIMSGGKLDAHYTYDGQESHEAWGEFQLDGYGIFLWALRAHADRHNRSLAAYDEAIQLLQLYLVKHWQEPCFDWWEERVDVHAATLACIYAGLKAFNHPIADTVKSRINLDTERVDASLIVCGLFDAVDDKVFAPRLEKIEQELIGVDGGVYRYTDDTYFGGGEWPVLSALLGLYYIKIKRVDEAKVQLAWCVNQIDEKYWLPEQAQIHMLHPEEFDGWVERVGRPANPLLWSHAMMMILALELRVVL